MKKLLVSIGMALLLVLSSDVKAQFSKADLFKASNTITWIGIDYTEVKFIGPATGWGDEGTKSPTEMRDKYFPAWNELIIGEPKAFKLAEAVSRTELNSAIEITAAANAKMDKKEIFSENIGDFQLLKEGDVQNMIKKYDFKGKEGIGFMMVAEGMSKGREEASYWVTFVDMKTKNVLLTKRVLGKAAGFGFRNYWAGTVKSVLKSMKKDFKNWE